MRIAFPLVFTLALTAAAQDPAALMRDPTIQAALAAAEKNEAHFIEEQIRVCEIPAPPFKEEVRGKEF